MDRIRFRFGWGGRPAIFWPLHQYILVTTISVFVGLPILILVVGFLHSLSIGVEVKLTQALAVTYAPENLFRMTGLTVWIVTTMYIMSRVRRKRLGVTTWDAF